MKKLFLIGFFLISSLYVTANPREKKYISLDIGECILNIPSTSRVGISSDYDATFVDMANADVYTLGWRKDALSFWRNDLHKYNIKTKQNRHLTIIHSEDSLLYIIVGRNFFISIPESSENFQKHILSCNDTWRDDITKIDLETMINEFYINDKAIKIMEEVIQKVYDFPN